MEYLKNLPAVKMIKNSAPLSVFLSQKKGAWIPRFQVSKENNLTVGELPGQLNNNVFLCSFLGLPFMQERVNNSIGNAYKKTLSVLVFIADGDKKSYMCLPTDSIFENKNNVALIKNAMLKNNLFAYEITFSDNPLSRVPVDTKEYQELDAKIKEFPEERERSLIDLLQVEMKLQDISSAIYFNTLLSVNNTVKTVNDKNYYQQYLLKKPRIMPEMFVIQYFDKNFRKEARYKKKIKISVHKERCDSDFFLGETINISNSGLKIILYKEANYKTGDILLISTQKDEKNSPVLESEKYIVASRESNNVFRLSEKPGFYKSFGMLSLSKYIKDNAEEMVNNDYHDRLSSAFLSFYKEILNHGK